MQDKVSFGTSVDFLSKTWFFLTINFGIGHLGTIANHRNSFTRFAIFTILLSALIIWIHYGAFIFAMLSVNIIKLPFNSPEALLKSDFYLTTTRGGLIYDIFSHAETGSIYQQLYLSKMNQSSPIISTKEELQKVLDTDNLAIWYPYGSISSYEEYRCKVFCLYTLLATTYDFNTFLKSLDYACLEIILSYRVSGRNSPKKIISLFSFHKTNST